MSDEVLLQGDEVVEMCQQPYGSEGALQTLLARYPSLLTGEPTKPDPNEGVVEWLRSNEPEIAVDPIILGEVRFGILLLPRGRRRNRLERWFEEGVRRLQCIPWEASTGLRWAELLATLRSSGRAMPIKDSLIARPLWHMT